MRQVPSAVTQDVTHLLVAAILLVALPRVAAASNDPTQIPVVTGTTNLKVAPAPPGHLRWNVAAKFPLQFGSVLIDVVDQSEPTPARKAVRASLQIDRGVVPLAGDHEKARDNRYFSLYVQEELRLSDGARQLSIAVGRPGHTRQLVLIQLDGGYRSWDLHPDRPSADPRVQWALARYWGVSHFKKYREACLAKLVQVVKDDSWGLPDHQVHPCLDAMRTLQSHALEDVGTTREGWIDLTSARWTLDVLQTGERQNVLAVLRLLRSLPLEWSGADAISFFETAFQIDDKHGLIGALHLFSQWGDYYGHNTSDMVPSIPPGPDGTLADWRSEIERARPGVDRLQPVIEGFAADADAELSLTAIYTLIKTYPAGVDGPWESRLLDIALERPDLRTRASWPMDLIALNGIWDPEVEKALAELVRAAEPRVAVRAAAALLTALPEPEAAEPLFLRGFELIPQAGFVGGYQLITGAANYPELYTMLIPALAKLMKQTDSYPGESLQPGQTALEIGRTLETMLDLPSSEYESRIRHRQCAAAQLTPRAFRECRASTRALPGE
ncbi:MAG: hypothetical protein QNJ40_23845 [Xanthomonadales bacterium]|nr:hypothetical protein [Xanthomonadales bacterium]